MVVIMPPLILAGDVRWRQLREAISGVTSSTSSSLLWPHTAVVQLEEEGNQRSIDNDQRSIERWSQAMEKCVDAAPLIVRRLSGHLVIIGSHSGLVVCVEEREGVPAALKWTSRVSHRVETAAVVCGEGTVAVCSYDGVLTCFDVESGVVEWRYDCAASVRGGPLTAGGFVYVADYDGQLHKLDITKRRRLWCTRVGGAMRAPPTVESGMAATVSIQGATSVVDTASGEILWSEDGKRRPIFAAGLFLRSESRADYRLVTVDVDGHVTMRNAETGVQIQSISIDARVFSTPLQIESNIVIVTASDAGKASSVLILDENLNPLKRIDFSSLTTVSIYHTPIVRSQSIVMMTSSGMMITVPLSVLIDAEIDSRSVVSKRLLPSGGPPIFSPPRFVRDDAIVIGTRDDVVVSLQL